MKTAIALTLIILGGVLVATPLILSYLATTHGSQFFLGGDAPLNCQVSGMVMFVVGIIFSFVALLSGGGNSKPN